MIILRTKVITVMIATKAKTPIKLKNAPFRILKGKYLSGSSITLNLIKNQ
ncbi:MAG TPA: hypothetical protein PKE69_07795 [Pyrinomonadaceae bacterium]|nr:hypothetical protein [Pyrinomonadaceae bacterium]